jgi:O-antigen/teichoic acid export membrane protein
LYTIHHLNAIAVSRDGRAVADVTGSPGGSLDAALFHGIGWTALGRWLAQAFSWAITFYAARVLTPGDFGLAAMAAMPIGLAAMVEDLGLDGVIVQDRELTRRQISELSGLALVVGASLIGVFAILAVPIGHFFHERAVTAMIMVLSLRFVADALQIVPRALLQRDLAFRRLAGLNALNVAVGATALGIYARLGFRQWALILNAVTASFVIALVLNLVRPHPIHLPRKLAGLRRSMISGGQLMLSRLAWYGYSNLDQTIIGRMLGKTPLGTYSFAMTFASIPVQEVTSLVGKVVPGVFTTVQHDLPQLRRYYLLLTEAISYLTMPMSIGIALVADDFVSLALGPQWQGVVTPLRILCIYAAMTSAQSMLTHVLLWTGRFRANMLLNLLSLVLLPLAFLVGAHWGIAGVAWAVVIAFPLAQVPAFYIVDRVLALRFLTWLAVLGPSLAGCLAMALVVMVVRSQLGHGLPPALRLGLEAPAGAATYAVVMLVTFHGRIQGILRLMRRREAAADRPA